MTRSTPPQAGRTVAVGVFDRAAQARQAMQALVEGGAQQQVMELIVPGGASGESQTTSGDETSPRVAVDGETDVGELLATRGVPEGERRFYAAELESGRALLVVDAAHNYPAVRQLILEHGGYDVQSRGADLARPEGAGVSGGTGPRPVDVTGDWAAVASRYEMLWQQHYGTSDATWDAMEPIYRYAWEVANQPRLRGRPWGEVESSVRQDWQSRRGSLAWDEVAGPIRDVWEDVAAEAARFAEGGRTRNLERPLE
jgi:hypothetical protein